MNKLRTMCLLVATAGIVLAQGSMLYFEDVKLYYQKPGETNWREDKALLALDGGQRVMIVLKDNRPLFVMRYDNIDSLLFDHKKDRTLTVKYGGDSGPSGTVRMELPGKWKEILETIRSQSQRSASMIEEK